MTTHQHNAIQYPCEFAEQCVHQRYKQYVDMGDETFSVMLTINVGEE